MRATAPGEFQLQAFELGMSNRWRLRLRVLINDFEETQLETEAAFPP